MTDTGPMQRIDQAAQLARQLVRVRRNLESESPFGPAWAATSEWVDDLERQIRELGNDLGVPISAARSDRPLN